MKEFKIRRAMLRITAAFTLIGWFGIVPIGLLKPYAMAISDQMMEQALLEGFGTTDLEEISDSYYDMDINQFAEQYLEKLSKGELTVDGFQGETIKNPKMRMTTTEDGNILYTLPNGSYYEANFPNGTITRDAVTIVPGSEVIAVVTKDGTSSRLFESWHFSDPGHYHIKMIFYRFDAVGSIDTVLYEVNHYFTILDRVTGKIGMVPAPDGFEIVSAKLNGLLIPIENPAGLFLEKDGLYEIRFRDRETGSIYKATSFERDTTAPFLTFSKELVNGKAEGPIEFTTQDVDDRVYVSYSGNTSLAFSNTLSAAGKHTLIVEDTVGNRRSYSVELVKEKSLFTNKLVILALILLLGTGARFLLLGRDMKVI